jgi:PKD repeat protein
MPSVIVTGAVAIDPSAVLNLVVLPGTAAPHGSILPLIVNDASDAIGGQFTGFGNNAVLTTPDGVPLRASYMGGDGNDLTLTAGNVSPQISSVIAMPSPVVAGQPVALSVTASDANQDPLATTWTFGDGATATGAPTSHTYTSPGTYTAAAMVSDGLAQAQSSTVITVTGPTGPGARPAGTTTVNASGFGAHFGLTAPSGCVRKGTAFSVTLSIKAKSKVLVKVTKVDFALGPKTVGTDRSVPYRVRLTIARAATSGSTVKLHAKAYLKLHGGKRATKSITTPLKVC